MFTILKSNCAGVSADAMGEGATQCIRRIACRKSNTFTCQLQQRSVDSHVKQEGKYNFHYSFETPLTLTMGQGNQNRHSML